MLLRSILFIVLSYSFCTRIPQYDFLIFSKYVKSTSLMDYLRHNLVQWISSQLPPHAEAFEFRGWPFPPLEPTKPLHPTRNPSTKPTTKPLTNPTTTTNKTTANTTPTTPLSITTKTTSKTTTKPTNPTNPTTLTKTTKTTKTTQTRTTKTKIPPLSPNFLSANRRFHLIPQVDKKNFYVAVSGLWKHRQTIPL